MKVIYGECGFDADGNWHEWRAEAETGDEWLTALNNTWVKIALAQKAETESKAARAAAVIGAMNYSFKLK